VWACCCFCVGLAVGVWLLAHLNTPLFSLSSTHFLRTFRIRLDITHPIITHFSWCQCDHTIYNLGIHLLHCLCKNECTTTHDTFQDTVVTIALKLKLMHRERFFIFFLVTHKDKWIISSPKIVFESGGRCKCWSNRFGAMCFDDNNTCNDSCRSRQGIILHRTNIKK